MGFLMRRVTVNKIAAVVAMCALSGLTLGAAEQTWTGEISDSACAFEHESGTENVPPPPAKECVANCVRGGSKYVLLSDGKILQIANQTLPALAELAGSPVTVTGEASGDTITIASIKKAE
jgi:hypothetical protein